MRPYIMSIAGFSGSGKTTLIEKLIPIMKERGYSIAVIKHDVHSAFSDIPGTDTFRFREAGADATMLSSDVSGFSSYEKTGKALREILEEVAGYDLVFIEGYKREDVPKLLLLNNRNNYEIPENISGVRAIVTDDKNRTGMIAGEIGAEIPIFEENETYIIAQWIISDMEKDIEKRDLNHFDDAGNARMVDVGEKPVTKRCAIASARVFVNRNTLVLIKSGGIKKGDVLNVARIAGIMGAKRTPELIPMCHPVIIDSVDMKLWLDEQQCAVCIEAKVSCTGRTGVEMEALTACSSAGLTVIDMCKSVQHDMVLSDLHLVRKTGGSHGNYKLAAAVLTGGRSSRMGRPKENEPVPGDGRTFLEKICDEVDSVGDELFLKKYLSVRRDQDIYRAGFDRVEDEIPDIGPLGGMISVLKRAESDGIDAVLMLACDLISIDSAEIKKICRAFRGEDIVFTRTENGGLEPLASVYGVSVLVYAREMASRGDHRPRNLAGGAEIVAFYDTLEDWKYKNCNRPAEEKT